MRHNQGAAVALSKLIATASARWQIEEDHELSKQTDGLDAGQATRWKSWHRWTAVCLLAYFYLAVAVACSASTTPPRARTPG